MSEELNPNASLESPPVNEPEPEPEGAVDVQGRKMLPVAAIVEERTRVRAAEQKRAAEALAPVQQQAAQYQAQLQQALAELDAIKQQHAPKPPDIPEIGTDEAEKYARHYELFTPTGLDINRAKRIIADNRAEMKRIATEAAQQAVQGPQQEIATERSRQNFVWAANQRDANGRPLVDPRALAEQWSRLPAELTSKPEVAQHLLKTVAGEMLLSGKQPPAAPTYEPAFSEAPGGRRQAYAPSPIEKRLAQVSGMSEKEYSERAKSYQPGATNFLE